MKSVKLLGVMLIFASIRPSLLLAEVRYTFTPLAPTPDLFQVMPNAINNAGSIVGAATRHNYSGGPFLDTAEGFQFLPASMGWWGGVSLNSNDLVVGSGDDIARVWESGTMTDLPFSWDANWKRVTGINDANQIVGYGATPLTPTIPARWTKDSTGIWEQELLSMAGLTSAAPMGIANSGRVIGVGLTDTGMWPVVWDGDDPIALMVEWGWDGVANGLNENGTVVGRYVNGQEQYSYVPFKWDGAAVTELSIAGWAAGDARAVNEQNQIVGWVSSTADSNYSWRAALFENDIAIDLNTLIEPVPGWTLAEARSINDAGQIVGWGWQSVDGTDWNVMPQGFLLTPVPEPATLMLLTLALILRGRCR